MGRKPLNFKKIGYRVFLRKDQYEFLRELKKREKKPISELIRQAIDLLLQQYSNQSVQIPNSTMAMGRGFSSGNMPQVNFDTSILVSKDISGEVAKCQSGNDGVLKFLNNLDRHTLLERLEWVKKKVAEYYRKAYAYYKELEQMTKLNTQFDIRPLKQHLSENLNKCNQQLFKIKYIISDFIKNQIPIPEESTAYINQFYTLFQELKHNAEKKDWLIPEIYYQDWGRKTRRQVVVRGGSLENKRR